MNYPQTNYALVLLELELRRLLEEQKKAHDTKDFAERSEIQTKINHTNYAIKQLRACLNRYPMTDWGT